jgi:hypothetical protein
VDDPGNLAEPDRDTPEWDDLQLQIDQWLPPPADSFEQSRPDGSFVVDADGSLTTFAVAGVAGDGALRLGCVSGNMHHHHHDHKEADHGH